MKYDLEGEIYTARKMYERDGDILLSEFVNQIKRNKFVWGKYAID